MSGINWYENLDFVGADILESVPSIISHEYSRIKSLVNQHELYGALFQLKDTIETIIKLYVTLGIAEIYSNDEKNSNDIQLLAAITEKPLSLGDWIAFSQILVKSDLNENLLEILGDLVYWKNSSSVQVVNWRNRCIGHGALGYDNTREFQDDFLHMFNVVNKFFVNQKTIIDAIKVGIKKDGIFSVLYEASPVIGAINELFLKYDGKDAKEICLFPFLTIRDSQYYFFDSFIEAKKPRTDLLNYYWGRKIVDTDGQISKSISDIYHRYNKSRTAENLYGIAGKTESIEQDSFLLSMQNALYCNMTYDAEKCVDFEEWLINKMDICKKGVFLLNACRGMGKTVCIEQLENGQLSKRQREKNHITGICLKETTIKAIYINGYTNKNEKLILQDLEYKMISDAHYSIILRGEGIVSIDKSDTSGSTDVANYLNQMRRVLTQERLCQPRLLIVFDGIDELADTEMKFLRFIPKEQDLDEGIFVLLTSRVEEELTEVQRKWLDTLEFKMENVYTLDAPSRFENVKHRMTSFAQKKLDVLKKDDIDNLVKTAGTNFAYLHFLIEAQKNMSAFSNEYVLTDYINYYLQLLKRCYSDKYIINYYKVLYVFMNSNMPLELKEISLLENERLISFELLGVLRDMHGIIKAERTGKNCYSFEHELLKQQFSLVIEKDAKYHEAERELISGSIGYVAFIQQLSECIKEETDIMSLRKFYLLIANNIIDNHTQLSQQIDFDFLHDMYTQIVLASEKYFGLSEVEELLDKLSVSISDYIIKRYDFDHAEDMINFLQEEYNALIFTSLGLKVDFIPEKSVTDNKDKYTISCLKILFDARRDWNGWINKKIERNDLKDINNEVSELNDMYTTLSFCIGLRSKSDFSAEELLQAICQVLVQLISCYKKIGNDRLESRFLEKYIRYLNTPQMHNRFIEEASSRYIRLAELNQEVYPELAEAHMNRAEKIVLSELDNHPLKEIRGIEVVQYFFNRKINSNQILDDNLSQEAFDELLEVCEEYKKALLRDFGKNYYFINERKKCFYSIIAMFADLGKITTKNEEYLNNIRLLKEEMEDFIKLVPTEVSKCYNEEIDMVLQQFAKWIDEKS